MTQAKWKLHYSKTGMIVGLVLALPPLICVGLGSLMALRVTEGEIRANIQQAIGDTSLMMATHFKVEFENLLGHVQKEGEGLLFNFKAAELADAQRPLILGSIKPASETIVIDLVPEILDISLWRRGSPASVFDNDSVPRVTWMKWPSLILI